MASCGGVITILLIDGHDEDRSYYAQRLTVSIPDCVILHAKDGRSALALSNSNTIDCVVLELALPDMSGFEVLFELVPCARRPAVAVVVLTRLSYYVIADMAKQQGAQAVLLKRMTTGDELPSVILRAMAAVGPTGKDHPSGV